MASRTMQSQAHEHDEHHHPHSLGSQQVAHGTTEEQHNDHEKKSVLKKVKAKAKKIKDTITKHGHHDDHGHDQHHYENQHIPDDHDLDEEDEVDEDPEIHGAPIYDSAAVRNVIPQGQIKASKQGVNFGGTSIMGEEPHYEPKVVVVSQTTEILETRFIDPGRTFVKEERTMQPKVNLERTMNLEEDPHAPKSKFEAYAPANYQTKVTDPTRAGGAEIDITPIQKSIDRMTVQHEPIPNILPTISETQNPSLGIHNQFPPQLSTETKTPYPSSSITHDQNLPHLSSEIKTQYPKTHDQFTPVFSTSTETQHPFTNIHHDQNLPHFSSGTNTQNPYATSHDQFTSQLLPSEPKPQHHFPTSHDQHFPHYSNATVTTPNLLATEHKPQHSSAIRHDQYLAPSGATKTQYPSADSHDQFTPVLPPTEPKLQHSSALRHDQYLSPNSSAMKTQYPSIGTHDQFKPGFLPAEHKSQQQFATNLPQHSSAMKTQYPHAGIHDQFRDELPTDHHSAASHGQYIPLDSGVMKTQYPSAGSHDQFTPDFSTNKNITVEDQPQIHHESMENSSNQNNSYTDKIYSATSAIADKATTAKNVVASKLGYGEKGDNETTQKATETGENQGNQSSYTEKISSAIADKAASAKNAVASKLGYGEKGDNETTQSATGEKQENQSSYTEKISSATSAIADKAASAKNTVASKLGFGEKNETERDSNVTNSKASSAVSPAEYGNKKVTTTEASSAVSPAEYGKRIAASLTEKLTPVYGRNTGVGNEREIVTESVEQDKGVSMKDYLAEKLKPGKEDKALSDMISERMYKKNEDDVYDESMEGRDVKKVVSDAVHKRGDDVDEVKEVRRPKGKVTESEEVKKRLGSWDDVRDENSISSNEKGVVDMVKGVVGSWFGNPEENESKQESGDLSRNSGA